MAKAKGKKDKKSSSKESPEQIRLKQLEFIDKLKHDITSEESAFKMNTIKLQTKWRNVMKQGM